MKKVLALITIFSLVLTVGLPVAAKSDPKSIETVVKGDAVKLKVGDKVTLTVETEKHGSSYTEEWDGAKGVTTILDKDTGMYISKAKFYAERPGIYTITYSITMKAGKSKMVFLGRASKTIEVVDSVKFTGVEINDVSVTPVNNSSGEVIGYSAMGNVYTVWSDGSSKLYGTTYFFFSPNQISRYVYVTVWVDGEEYVYKVNVSR